MTDETATADNGEDGFTPESGASLIWAERHRQVDQEGWTPEHDDEHDGSEMVDAAVCYALHGAFGARYPGVPPENWPWAAEWWKPSTDPIRDLQRAGALIAAEIDRLLRASAIGGPEVEA